MAQAEQGSASGTRTNGLAIASLVCGIAAFLILGIVGGALALIFGYIGRRQIDESGGAQTGRGMATAGIVLGWISIALFVIVILIVVAS